MSSPQRALGLPSTLLVSPRPLPHQVQQGPILVILPYLTIGKSLYLSVPQDFQL